MKTINLTKVSFTLFDDISEIPIVNWHLFQKYLLYDSGIGSSFQDVVAHHQKIAMFAKEGKHDEAAEEANNTMTCLYFIENRIHPKHLAFASLIRSIDGKKIKDYSDEALKGLISRLSDAGLTAGIQERELESLKKNLNLQLNIRFPQFFGKDEEQDYIYQLRREITFTVDEMNDMDRKKELSVIQEYFNSLLAPKNFNPEDMDSVVNHLEHSFENICASINLQTKNNIKKSTVYEFYSTIELLKKKNK